MTKLVEVFRVENVEGVGPYRCPDNIEDLYQSGLKAFFDEESADHPLPETAFDQAFAQELMKDNSPWMYGFISLEDCVSWFHTDEVRDLLEKNGFVVNCYAVPESDVVEGYCQVAFLKDDVHIFDVLECSEI